MKKIKILVVPSDRTGVSYYRSTTPHIALERQFPNEFHVDIEYAPKLDDDNWLKQYDIIHYHRSLGSFEKMDELLTRLDNLGIATIMDIDDYWAPGQHHPAYHIIKAAELDKKILNNVRVARNVATTTEVFAEEIAKYNKSVFVLPNAVDPTEKQFQPRPEPSNRVRIGWLGGSSHGKDIEILNGVVSKLSSDGLMDKIQFVLCGFDLRGHTTIIDKETGEQKQRPITPQESVWYHYEKIFTNNYKIVSPEYRDFLMKFTQEEYLNVANEPYRRVWTKPISSYANNYNLFDISLAPIEPNMFNKAKSQLKIIEAGFHKKAVIAQDFGPYQLDVTNALQYGGGLDLTANGFLIDPKKNHKDWYTTIKKLVTEPELISVFGENLYNSVKDVYSINAVGETRRELYLDLVEKAKAKVANISESITR